MKVARLIVFNVPDRLGGLMERLRFRPTIKNPRHWYRLFNPVLKNSHDEARRVLAHLNTAGLSNRKWAMVGHELSSQVMEIWQPRNQGFGKPHEAADTASILSLEDIKRQRLAEEQARQYEAKRQTGPWQLVVFHDGERVPFALPEPYRWSPNGLAIINRRSHQSLVVKTGNKAEAMTLAALAIENGLQGFIRPLIPRRTATS